MSETSSTEEKGSPAPSQIGSTQAIVLRTSLSHQILTLVGASFLCFEFCFLYLYFDPFWFGVDLSTLGLVAILASLVLAHMILFLLETKFATRWLSFIFKGKPACFYRKWITLEADAFTVGVKRVRFDCIDELELSWFGNLIVKSRTLCGKEAEQPDIVVKFPFAAATFATQEQFLQAAKDHNSELVLNKKLGADRNAVWQKGTQVTQLFTAGLMSLLLLDVGFSSFYFLELLKNYYLSETDLLSGAAQEAEKHFQRAEQLREHPLPISWVSGKFLNNSSVAAGIWEQRARVLWLQGKRQEAIEDSVKAIKEAPTNLRHRLYQTRLLEADDRVGESKEQLEQILKDHKHSLLPRLYILAISKDREKNADRTKLEYKTQLDYCFEDTFEQEPQWPPGGNRHFMELLYSDDIIFLLDRFLGTKYKSPAFTPGQTPSNKD